ncbi:uncharacterized protein RHO17_023557 isoform 2-T2 [Thomomys bottae]
MSPACPCAPGAAAPLGRRAEAGRGRLNLQPQRLIRSAAPGAGSRARRSPPLRARRERRGSRRRARPAPLSAALRTECLPGEAVRVGILIIRTSGLQQNK